MNPDERRYQTVFERCPVSLWEEDIADLRVAIKEVQKQDGVELAQYLDDHPEFMGKALHLVRVVNVNIAAMRLWEAENKQALLGPLDSLLDYRDPLMLSYMKNEILAVAAGREYCEHEASILTRKGKRVDTLVMACIPREDGDCPFMVVSALDITDVRDSAERRRTERALQESEQKLRIAFQANPEAINLNRLSDGMYLDINEGFTRLMGYSREDVLGRTSLELDIWANPADRERLVSELKSAGRVDDLQARFRRKSGGIGIGVMSARILSIAGQQVILSLTRDITAEVELEEKYRQAQKMEAVGRLAGGVAHDFNNILTVIGGYAELAKERMEEAGLSKDEIKEIASASERGATLVAQLLAFSRKQVLQPKVIGINGVVTDIASLLLRLIGEDIELVTRLEADSGRARLDKGQIDQILMNLAANARDAMPQGGTLIIETSNVEFGAQYCREHPELDPGAYVLLSVSDTGIGMDRETLQRVFEPFFTTKPGKGTGLGLAMAYGIVKQSGGHIYAYSEPGVGTTFKIYFPRVYEDDDVRDTSVREDDGVAGTETILLVEDEASIRRYCTLVLRRAGYRVIEAESAPQALELLGNEPVQLVLTDVVMPQMSGQELARRVSERSPATRILFMSGYTENAIVHHGILDVGVDLLPKPFGSRDLLRRIREVLNG